MSRRGRGDWTPSRSYFESLSTSGPGPTTRGYANVSSGERGLDAPPLILREPQHERPRPHHERLCKCLVGGEGTGRPPAHTSRASARAAQAPPREVMQMSRRGRGDRTPSRSYFESLSTSSPSPTTRGYANVSSGERGPGPRPAHSESLCKGLLMFEQQPLYPLE